MAQGFLIKPATKNSRGIAYRVLKHRAWDDMPFVYLVQKYKMNYSLGKDRWTWAVTDKCETESEAIKVFERKIK